MALNYVNYIPSTRCLSSLKCVYGFSLCADSEAWSAFKPSGRDRSICCCFYRFLSISLPPVPNRERSSPFLAQLSRQLNIGIDFQSSASVAKLAEGLSSTVSSVTGLQRCIHFWRWNRINTFDTASILRRDRPIVPELTIPREKVAYDKDQVSYLILKIPIIILWLTFLSLIECSNQLCF